MTQRDRRACRWDLIAWARLPYAVRAPQDPATAMPAAGARARSAKYRGIPASRSVRCVGFVAPSQALRTQPAMIPARIVMGMTPLARILIVDDDREIVDLLREFLERNGYAVDSAANGREGLSRIVAARPDLVLLDIRMPDMDGMRALQLARAIDPTLAVIMVTGNEDIELARETLRAGAVDYVAKPLDLEYLTRAVAAAMRR